MNGSHHIGSEVRFKKFTPFLCHAKLRAQQRLSSSGAEGDNHIGFDYSNLGLKPGMTSSNFNGIGFLVNATLAARAPI